MKKNFLRVLLVEDNKTDAQLTERQILKADPETEIRTVKDLQSVENNIKEFKPQLIISDYRLPNCSGLDVLQLAEKLSPGTTFIFLTGAINDEELAANTILSGASGYFLKKNLNHLHIRLAPYFKAIKKNQDITEKSRNLVSDSREALNKIDAFLQSFDSINASHIEGIQKIREDLARLRKNYDS